MNNRFIVCTESYMPDWIGSRWLMQHSGISLVQDLRIDSAIGGSRSHCRDFTIIHEIYQAYVRPEATLAGNGWMH